MRPPIFLCEPPLWRAALLLLSVLSSLSLAAPAGDQATPAPLELHYSVRLLRPTSHLVDIEIQANKVTAPSLDFVMPAWSPGRYAIYDFAKNVQEFSAVGAAGQPLPRAKLDKQTWRVDTREAGGNVRVRYRVFANDLSGTFSQFDSTHANLNGPSLFLYIAGHQQDPLTLTVEAPADWKLISGFSDSTGQRTFQVADYDRLVDTPLEISRECLLEEFREGGKLFRVAVHSYAEQDSDLAKLVAGVRSIVRSQLAMMPEPEFSHYTFIFHFAAEIPLGDGMEHLNSTQIVVEGALSGGGLDEALELASHEFFHLWNVERLRPAELVNPVYSREQYTRSLWFAEGVTNYYGFVHLLRGGVWDRPQFLRRLAEEIRTLESEPGRKLMSAESASFHAWFYDRSPQMQETNFANTTINYYNKGALLGWLLDLEIRARTGGQKSLDDVVVAMYRKFYAEPRGGSAPPDGYRPDDILAAVNAIAGSDFTPFFSRYVGGTEPLPYDTTLAKVGLRLRVEVPPGSPPSLGVLTQPHARGAKIAAIRPGGAADRAGLSRDDLLIAVDELSLATTELHERLRMYPAGAEVPFTVERHGRVERISVALDPPLADHYAIEEIPEATPPQVNLRNVWLGTGK